MPFGLPAPGRLRPFAINVSKNQLIETTKAAENDSIASGGLS
jgi:hypothetical protein